MHIRHFKMQELPGHPSCLKFNNFKEMNRYFVLTPPPNSLEMHMRTLIYESRGLFSWGRCLLFVFLCFNMD